MEGPAGRLELPCKLEKVLYAGGLGEAIRGLLSWHPDLAGCPGPSGCSLLTPLPSYFKASLFSETLASFSMKLSHQINFLTPFLVPPKSQP